jgi:hypothetical protein
VTDQWWSTIGLVADIIGGFLVAVEAIGSENLRRLRKGADALIDWPNFVDKLSGER